MTIAGRKTAMGRPRDWLLTRSSANDFVKVYVFGQSPMRLFLEKRLLIASTLKIFLRKLLVRHFVQGLLIQSFTQLDGVFATQSCLVKLLIDLRQITVCISSWHVHDSLLKVNNSLVHYMTLQLLLWEKEKICLIVRFSKLAMLWGISMR